MIFEHSLGAGIKYHQRLDAAGSTFMNVVQSLKRALPHERHRGMLMER